MDGSRLARVASHVAPTSAAAAVQAQDDEESLVMAELLSRVTSLDPQTYKDNRLTAEEREFYAREGYLVVPGAISSANDLAELQGLRSLLFCSLSLSLSLSRARALLTVCSRRSARQDAGRQHRAWHSDPNSTGQ